MAVLSIRLPQLGLPAVENATVVLWDRTNDTKGTIAPSTATYVFTNVAGTATATLVPAELGQVNEVRIVIRGDVVFSATFFMPGADAFLDELPMNVEGDPYAGDDKFVAGLSTMQNDGGGAELFTGVVLSVAHLRTLLAGSGISIATAGDGIIITNTRADGAKGDQGIQGVAGTNGTNGTNGQSAYALAVAGGFVGNEAAWIDSLRGAQGIQGATGNTGAAGQSAYALAVALGFVGNQAQWIASLKGVKGDVGNDGPRGYSAYELAVQNGYAGSEASWIASLKGDAGVNGVNGIDGRSAYEIAVADGFLGSEPEWLATLVGISGVTAWDMTNLTVTCNKPLNMDGATAISNGFTGIPTVSELFTKAAYIVQSGLGAPESYAALSAIKLASPVLTGTRVVEWAITSDAISGGAATTAVKLSIGLVKASALASAVGFIELNYKEDGSVTAVLTTDLGSSSAVTLASAPSHISLAFNAGTIAVRVDNVAQAFSASTYTPTADATLITQFVEPASVTGFAFGKAFSAKQLTAASDFTDTHAAGAADLCGHIIGDAGLPSGPNSVIIVSEAGTYKQVYYDVGMILVVNADGVAVSLIGGLDDIADKTILGNISGVTAAPVALNQTQARGIVLPARMAFEDTAPTAANIVTGVGSVALFGSNNVIGSNGIASLSSDGITTTKTAFHTRLVADIASTGTIYNTAHRSAVIASNNCEMGTSASGTADTYAHLNAIVASANCVVKQSASGGQQSVTLVAASYGASITGNQQYTAYIGSYSITDTSNGGQGNFFGPSIAPVTFSGGGTANFVAGIRLAQTLQGINSIIIGGGGNTVANSRCTLLNAASSTATDDCVLIGTTSVTSYTNSGAALTSASSYVGKDSFIVGCRSIQNTGANSVSLSSFGAAGRAFIMSEPFCISQSSLITSTASSEGIRRAEVLMAKVTTNATPTLLCQPMAQTTTAYVGRAVLAGATHSIIKVTAEVVGSTASGAIVYSKTITASFKGSVGAAPTQIGSTVTVDNGTDAGASTWSADFSVASAGGQSYGVLVSVVGDASSTVRWAASVRAINLLLPS